MIKIYSWNINGIKARLELLIIWLNKTNPDIICLQETKSIYSNFPYKIFNELGYYVAYHGQKQFNGVAILSKYPLKNIKKILPGNYEDQDARYIETQIKINNKNICICCIYLPNGNPIYTKKFFYKINWLDRLIKYSKNLLNQELPILILGDYNIIPYSIDAKFPHYWMNDASFHPILSKKFRILLNIGFFDAIRAVNNCKNLFTFWQYKYNSYLKNNGIRIDHILLSSQAIDLMLNCGIDTYMRGENKPSDHVPVWIEINI